MHKRGVFPTSRASQGRAEIFWMIILAYGVFTVQPRKHMTIPVALSSGLVPTVASWFE